MHADMMANLDIFAAPKGRLLLANYDRQTVGCICMKELTTDIGEIKRMYVRPEFRGKGIGKALITGILYEARMIGYDGLRLDSTKFMHAAHHLYRSLGFAEIEPYSQSEIPEEYQQYWVFMELKISRLQDA